MRGNLGKEWIFGIILGALVVLVGVVLVLNYLSFIQFEDLVLDRVRESQHLEATNAAGQLESHLARILAVLAKLGSSSESELLQREQCLVTLGRVHNPIDGVYEPIYLAASDGIVIACSTPDVYGFLGKNISSTDYFGESLTHSPHHVSISRYKNTSVLLLTSPVLVESTFSTSGYLRTAYPPPSGGLYFSVVNLDELEAQYLSVLNTNSHSSFFVITSDNRTVWGNSEYNFSQILSDVPFRRVQWSGIAQVPFFGESVLSVSPFRVADSTWRIIVVTPLSSLGNDKFSVRISSLVILVVGLVIGVVVSILVFLWRQRVRVEGELVEAQSVLRKYGILGGIEASTFHRADISLTPHRIYLVLEEENHAHELFISCLDRGYAGLGIVRDDPRQIRERYHLSQTSFIWLSKHNAPDVVSETDISPLFLAVREFVKASKKSVILIDRIDYLIRHNTLEIFLRHLSELKDLAGLNDCIFILNAHPDLVSESEIGALRAETVDLYGEHLQGGSGISLQEKSILQFVNDHNICHTSVSFKDISSKFGITKPTTRVKIGRLVGIGLLDVEERGRHKVLSITSRGRRMLR